MPTQVSTHPTLASLVHMPINDSECLLQLYKNRRKRQNKFFPMLNGPCSSLLCSHALTLLLTTFSPKTDETDGMMDRPPQNQTNTPAKREEKKKKQASLSKQEGRVCILHIPPDGWMTDYSPAAYNIKQTCISTMKIIFFNSSLAPSHAMTQRIQNLKSCMTQCF